MKAKTLLFYIFLQILSFPRGFALDNCTELQRHKRLARNGDYIGCYDLGCLNLEHNISFPENMGTTPKSCSARCGDKGFILAYVYQGSGCSCSCDGECLETPVEDYRCGLPCRQDFNQFCGGLNSSAVYKVRSPNVSQSNTTDGQEQTYDGSDCEPEHYATLVSVLVISCLIICALVITVVVFYRRLRKVTSSRNLRMYSEKSSIRQINRHTTQRPHAAEEGGEHDHQVGAELVSPTNRGQAPPSRAPHGHLSNDSQSPTVDDEQISPYEVSFDHRVDHGALHSPHYSTLERTDVVASNFEGYNDEYTQPGVGLDMINTPGFACDKDGYLLPGSSLRESTPRHVVP